MAATIPSAIFGLRGQCVKSVSWNDDEQTLLVECDRDGRFAPVEKPGGRRCTVNRRLRRRVRDLPLWGCRVTLSIAYCQLKVGAVDRRMEYLDFVGTGMGYTHRFTRFVSQLCAMRDVSHLRHDELDARCQKYLETIKQWLSSYDMGTDETRIRLDLQYEDSRGFIDALVAGRSIQSTAASVNKMAAAYRHIRQFLQQLLAEGLGRLTDFARFFLTRVELVVIESENLGSALTIFETINQRGVGLNAMDLVKNLLFSRAHESQFSKIKDIWKRLTDYLETCDDSSKPLRFLRYFLMARYHNGILRSDAIYKWIISKEGEQCLGYTDDPLRLVKEMECAAKRYAALVNATGRARNHLDGETFPHVTHIGYINKYGSRQHLLLLLALDDHCSDATLDYLGEQLESFMFFVVALGMLTKTYERSFSQWAVELRGLTRREDIQQVVADKLLPFIQQRLQAFKERFGYLNHTHLRPQYRERFVLGTLENHMRHRCGLPLESLAKMQRMQVEHILPQTVHNAPAQGPLSDEQRGQLTYKLGNVTLLESTINQAVNYCNDLACDWFGQKQAEYAKSELLMVRLLQGDFSIGKDTALNRFVNQSGYAFTEWDNTTIEKRQHILMELALDHWRFNGKRVDEA